jgi:hypothetical protein
MEIHCHLSLSILFAFIVLFASAPYDNDAFSQKIVNNQNTCPHCAFNSAGQSTQYGPVKLEAATSPAKNITTLRTTNANISFLQFSTSYNYQYVTWSELFGRNNVIFVASSRNGGHTFDPATNLSSTIGDSSNAHFVVNLDRMYGVFVQHQSAKHDIIKFTGTNDGGIHWNTFTLANPRGIVEQLAIGLQGYQVSVVWSDSDNMTTVNHYNVNG